MAIWINEPHVHREEALEGMVYVQEKRDENIEIASPTRDVSIPPPSLESRIANTSTKTVEQHKKDVGMIQEQIKNLFGRTISGKNVESLMVLAFKEGVDLEAMIENTQRIIRKYGLVGTSLVLFTMRLPMGGGYSGIIWRLRGSFGMYLMGYLL